MVLSGRFLTLYVAQFTKSLYHNYFRHGSTSSTVPADVPVTAAAAIANL